MTTIDELLKAHPLPWTTVDNGKDGDFFRDANGECVYVYAYEHAVGVRDLVNAYTTLLGRNAEIEKDAAVYNSNAAYSEHMRKHNVMGVRLAELEAFAERMKGAPGRLADSLDALGYMFRGIAVPMRSGRYDADVYGPGPLPWDEKGGVK